MKTKRRSLFSLSFIIPNIILVVAVWSAVALAYIKFVNPRVTDLMLQRALRNQQPSALEAVIPDGQAYCGDEVLDALKLPARLRESPGGQRDWGDAPSLA